MKILHYSDQADENLRQLFQECDVFITTGDLSIFDFTPIEDIIKTKPSFGVYGNHDTPGYLEKLDIKNLHLKTIKWNNYVLGGFQGCLRYKEGGGPQFSEEEAKNILNNYPSVDILLLHAAPFGLLDTPNDPVHTGSLSIREYVDRTKPKYIFCGHDSPSGELEYQGIRIWRTHKARIIEV